MAAKRVPLHKQDLPGFLAQESSRIPIALAMGFLLVVATVVYFMVGHYEKGMFLVVAAVFGAYMALNIGANDAANNVAPAVGAKALTVMAALLIDAVCELAGALIAGGAVTRTISGGIIDASLLGDDQTFILIMLTALLSAAIWVNLATYIGAPVSTTHSLVGAVMGSGVAAAGVAVVNWAVMGKIAASWVISPLLGGAIAATCYFSICRLILEREDKLAAAKKWVPVFVGIMAGAFSAYLLMKGLSRVVSISQPVALTGGVVIFIAVSALMKPYVARRSLTLENRKKSVNKLFTYPLIGSAAMLSFAHGANDVSNAIGPVAAIAGVVGSGSVQDAVGIPLWVMLIGGLGLSIGMLLFGSKLIHTVGKTITKLDHSRSYCVALSAAVTVIIASALGLPVSTTHIAVGSIFGIGLFREFRAHFKRTSKKKRKKKEKEYEHQVLKRKLVRRRHLISVLSAWVITVPSSALISAVVFFGLRFTVG